LQAKLKKNAQEGVNRPWTVERKILRKPHEPVQQNEQWIIRCDNEIYGLCKDRDMTAHSTQKFGIAGMNGSRTPRKNLGRQMYSSQLVGKPKDRWTNTAIRDARKLIGRPTAV
jgi:hypothetical protein